MNRSILFCMAAISCDVLTTYVIVNTLGGSELNPLMNQIIIYGWETFLLVKYGIGFLVPLWHSTLTDSKRMLSVSAWLHLVIALVNSISLAAHQL